MHRKLDLTEFTPFGYLRNPSHRARAWGDTDGGNLRTTADRLGVEWAYPVGRDASSRAGLAIEASADGRTSKNRADFDAIGMACRYHSCLIFGCEWRIGGVLVEARFFLVEDDILCARVEATNTSAEPRHVSLGLVEYHEGVLPTQHAFSGDAALDAELLPGETRRVAAALARGSAVAPDSDIEDKYARLLAEDAAFDARCPKLAGDWPAHWAEGLHHDFQTTRMLVQPPGGIFKDVWPTWMVAWPRVVFAEGTLDMLRLAYADPELAQRAVLSVLRDAPEPNIPCVFEGGEYNMVAADGSRCGTSPAWCLPFINLQLLYLRTLDRQWLREIYPRAAAYVEWWLAHRTDRDGWVVYKCTWESGEDGNPRLDPTGSGDADISGRVRPVELQATLAHAATVLAFFAEELQLDAARWHALARDYTERTSGLFDAEAGRYRDWLMDRKRLQEPCPDRPYWGIDPCRYSAQSVTPLLLGLPLDEAELRRHLCPPWTLWPSWTWSLVESGAAAGLFSTIGELASETIDRVYRATTRRTLGSFAQPLPGVSPEFWPEDWRTYGGSDAYGWGATTANLLIRHLFGFKESRLTDGCVFDLTPAFPSGMLAPGATYAIEQLSYRGRGFDLAYTITEDGLRVQLSLADGSATCRASRDDAIVYSASEPARRHAFDARLGQRVSVRLA